MAKVIYAQTMQVGGSRIQLERTENMAEDWTWRTVKLIGFIIGSFAVLWWIFNGGRLWEQYFPTNPSPTHTIIYGSVPAVPKGGGGATPKPIPPHKTTPARPIQLPPGTPSVIILNHNQIEVVEPEIPSPSPPARPRSNRPGIAW